jgi:hypothetical protein
MKTEQTRKLIDESIERLGEAIKSGQSEMMRAYLAAMARFHRYSFGNTLLIFVQRPAATHVAGVQTWKKFGRHVREGERGIAILAPMMLKCRAETPEAEDDTPQEGRGPSLRFRAVHVFDVSQTEGEALPQPSNVTGDPGERLSKLRAFVAAKTISLEYADMYGAMDGFSSGGRIVIRRDMPAAQEFAVLVHELAHELLHRGPERASISRTVRETEAEAVAFVVSQAFGLDTNTACSDYIQLYQGDSETLAASLDRIQRTSGEIIDAIAAEPPPQADHAVTSGEVRS